MFEFSFNDRSSFLINTKFLESAHKIQLTPGIEKVFFEEQFGLVVLMFELSTVVVGVIILVWEYIVYLDYF